MKALVCSQNGLGDLFFALTLSYNLSRGGYKTTLYHGSGTALQNFFPHTDMQRYPGVEQVEDDLAAYDCICIIFHEEDAYVREMLRRRESCDRIKIIYSYPTHHVKYKPFYEDSRIDPTVPFVNNLQRFMRESLSLDTASSSNGARLCEVEKQQRRIALHVTSSCEKKDWPIERFMQLGDRLEAAGFEPHFITKEPKYFESEWAWLEKKGYRTPLFYSLSELGAFLSASQCLIGVDSGVCHFASSLGVPTIVIGRRKFALRFWQPGWAPSTFVCPSSWIPNIRGMRLRDKHWKRFVSVKKVFHTLQSFL